MPKVSRETASESVTTDGAVWFALRLVAGIASALVFVIAVSAVLVRLREHGKHLVGWVFGGVGAGIALSGLLVLLLRSVAGWQAASACFLLLSGPTNRSWRN